MLNDVHFILIRVETDQDIKKVSDKIEALEDMLTQIDVIDNATISFSREDEFGGPVIYFS